MVQHNLLFTLNILFIDQTLNPARLQLRPVCWKGQRSIRYPRNLATIHSLQDER
jgi:hypothetical protein